MNKRPDKKDWLKFVAGLIMIVAMVFFFISEPVPPGALGGTIRQNIDKDIQATALFYMDYDQMQTLESYLDDINHLK